MDRMDKICQYSTIIFAGNVSVLLIVALTTDYWEYRGFKRDEIMPKLLKANGTTVFLPQDTETYILVRFTWDPGVQKQSIPSYPANETYYQPPIILHRYYTWIEVQVLHEFNNGTANISYVEWEWRRKHSQDVVVLFLQYGNLFRDCDDLEPGVRKRLNVAHFHSQRCFNFITSLRSQEDYINRELPAVIHLERIAFLLSIICIISSVVSVVGGAIGSVLHDKVAILTASSAALISGMTMTVTIAIFHGKCHLRRRREILDGLEVAHKKLLNDHRHYYFGWSFALAWICIVLAYVHTWVWLLKAQDMPEGMLRSRRSFKSSKERYYGANDNLAMIEADDGSIIS